MSLMNSYGMLQNVRVTAFTELLRENQQCVCMGGGNYPQGRVAWWLATCARKPKIPSSSPAASYVQR